MSGNGLALTDSPRESVRKMQKYNVIENTLSDLPIDIKLKFITKGIINMNMEYRERTDEEFCVAYLRKA